MTATDTAPPPRKASKLPLLLGIVLGLAGGGGGFMATRMGLFGASGGDVAGAEHAAEEESHVAEGAHGGTTDHAADDAPAAEGDHAEEGGDAGHGGETKGASFVPLDPLIVNVDSPEGGRYLRFVAQVEAAPGKAVEVEANKPRFADVLNGYLRAVDIADLENPRALDLLRGQMLRRLQTVAGEGAIRDLLIVEFVLN
jgi:flagellar FliL protein